MRVLAGLAVEGYNSGRICKKNHLATRDLAGGKAPLFMRAGKHPKLFFEHFDRNIEAFQFAASLTFLNRELKVSARGDGVIESS